MRLRSFVPSSPARYALAVLLTFSAAALSGCSDAGEEPGGSDTGADTKADAGGTACTGHADCVGKVPGLGTCEAAMCDPATHTCVAGPAADYAPCDDGEPCTAESWCEGGECVAGNAQTDCDDGSPCTADGCKPGEGCVHTPVTGPCDDGDPCTTNDLCGLNGVCAGTSIGSCSCVTDADCAQFDDGDLCNGSLECVAGRCRIDPMTVVVCPDAGPCADNVCNPLNGQCQPKAKADGTACSDGSACTTGDTCSGGFCVGTPVCTCDTNDDCALLEDGDLCNGRLTCSDEGLCVLDVKTIVDCGEPSGACFQTRCVPETGTCVEEPLADGAPCAVDDPCLDKAKCLDGECQGGFERDCNDGNPCTLDLCVPGVGCEHQSNEGAVCDDGDPCTTGDKCSAGQCKSGNNVCGTCGDNLCSAAESCETCPNDCGQCPTQPGCGNGVCEMGEEFLCPQDCTGGGGDVCGDGICGMIEFITCPDDCTGGGGLCDGVCDMALDFLLCPSDCAPDTCGDGVCQELEELTCPEDCEVVVEPEPDAGPTDAGSTEDVAEEVLEDIGPVEEVLEDIGPVEDVAEDAAPGEDAVDEDATPGEDAVGEDATPGEDATDEDAPAGEDATPDEDATDEDAD